MHIYTSLYAGISIHAPLTGSDHDGYAIINLIKNFNPRSPYGERPRHIWRTVANKQISIHAPLTGSDADPTGIQSADPVISIHAPLTGSDLR